MRTATSAERFAGNARLRRLADRVYGALHLRSSPRVVRAEREDRLLSDQPQQTEPPRYWTQSTARWRQQQEDTQLRRFLGGSPLTVVARLVLVSILVGALLMWLDIRPADVFAQLGDLADRLWALGFQSLRDLGTYIVAGAIIVVPLWLILRLLSYRGR